MSESFDINSTDEKKGGIIDTYKEIKKERKDRDQTIQLLATSFPNMTNLKSYIESILLLPNYEDILWNVVETLNKNEQIALDDESKKKIYWEKRIMGIIFTHANAYGDQYSLLKELARQLGYSKLIY